MRWQQKQNNLENPWLIDEDGKLRKWEPNYSAIEGGHSSAFTEFLLGENNGKAANIYIQNFFGSAFVNKKNEYKGNYTDAEQFVFRMIDKGLKRSDLYNDGTRSDIPKNAPSGYHDNHAYSIMDVFEKDCGGKKLKFVRLRNPHGGGTSRENVYQTDETGKIIGSTKKSSDNGFSDIELRDFVKTFSNVYANCKTYADEIVEKPKPKEPVDAKTISQYHKVLHALDKKLDGTLSRFCHDSDEFSNLNIRLNNTVATLQDSYRGEWKDFEAKISKLEDRSMKYKAHCEEDKRPYSIRRAKREKINKAVEKICRLCKNKVKYPVDALNAEIAEKIISYQADKMRAVDPQKGLLIDDNKEQLIKSLLRAPAFASGLGNADVLDLVLLSEKSKQEVGKQFANVTIDMESLEKKGKSEKQDGRIMGRY